MFNNFSQNFNIIYTKKKIILSFAINFINYKTMKTYPKRFSHIGITVPDINKAAKFYSEVMGWYTIMPPSLVKKETDTAIGQMCIDVFGDD